MANTTHRPAISAMEHARLAGELIHACGGLAEASRACRVSEGVLIRCRASLDAAEQTFP